MSDIKTTVEVTCWCCGEPGIHGGRGLRRACYSRYLRAGTLDQFPPLKTGLPCLWRLEEYAELRNRRISVRVAAERIGVSKRTAERYEARLKAPEAAR
ncbi:hypothetical protein [Nonomuraea lactucae]|uniref:hypothetical protein n=1 Tax=Nonomuraea lactucae TaxID=2249762 RepID=UPI0013B439AD|nr:hypothetical protein [Nonomuraea lactucae]